MSCSLQLFDPMSQRFPLDVRTDPSTNNKRYEFVEVSWGLLSAEPCTVSFLKTR